MLSNLFYTYIFQWLNVSYLTDRNDMKGFIQILLKRCAQITQYIDLINIMFLSSLLQSVKAVEITGRKKMVEVHKLKETAKYLLPQNIIYNSSAFFQLNISNLLHHLIHLSCKPYKCAFPRTFKYLLVKFKSCKVKFYLLRLAYVLLFLNQKVLKI